jgi:hypothetical protein
LDFAQLTPLILEGLLRSRREELLDDFGGSDKQAIRFADAMGIAPSRTQRVYDDLEYAPAPRRRLEQVVYRDSPPQRRQVMRRVVGDYMDSPRVVQVVERIRQPQRRIQVSFLPFIFG